MKFEAVFCSVLFLLYVNIPVLCTSGILAKDIRESKYI